MKKLIFTAAAAVFCLTVNAQNAFQEKWPNGNIKMEGTVIGEIPANASASKEEQARQLSTQVRDGKWTTYFENGKLRSEEYYNKGTMTGTWKVFYDNGTLESSINFSTGKAEFFHKSGAKHSEGSLLSGMIHTGDWICFHENGNKNYEGSYDSNGNKNGTWKWYDEQGKLVSEQVFEKGNLLSTKSASK